MKNLFFITLISTIGFLCSCETAEDTIAGMDTIVPEITISQDSSVITAGQSYNLNFTVEDPSGIKRIDITYGDWNISEVIDFSIDENYPETYEHTITFTVPTDAWKSKVATGYYHNGTSYTYTEYYHKITIIVSDTKLNERTSLAAIKVQ